MEDMGGRNPDSPLIRNRPFDGTPPTKISNCTTTVYRGWRSQCVRQRILKIRRPLNSPRSAMSELSSPLIVRMFKYLKWSNLGRNRPKMKLTRLDSAHDPFQTSIIHYRYKYIPYPYEYIPYPYGYITYLYRYNWPVSPPKRKMKANACHH